MKNWQFNLLMAAIYVSPLTAGWLNAVVTAVFLAISAVEIIKDR